MGPSWAKPKNWHLKQLGDSLKLNRHQESIRTYQYSTIQATVIRSKHSEYSICKNKDMLVVNNIADNCEWQRYVHCKQYNWKEWTNTATWCKNGVIDQWVRKMPSISQGNVTTRSRCGGMIGICNDDLNTNVFLSLTVKNYWKIGQHLAKLLATVGRHLSETHCLHTLVTTNIIWHGQLINCTWLRKYTDKSNVILRWVHNMALDTSVNYDDK